MINQLTVFRRRHPIAHAIGRGILGFAVSKSLGALGDKVGLSLRHGRETDPELKRFARKHPVLTVLHGSFIAPVGEEYVFRYLPSRALDKKGRSGFQASTAITISLVFAAGHYGPSGIPVPQFLGGLNSWEIQRADGYAYAVITHSVRNTLGTAYRYYKWHKADQEN